MQAPDAAAGGQEPKDTILVVEDDPDIVEMLRLYLERSGYRFLSAGDGKHGLDVLHEGEASPRARRTRTPCVKPFRSARSFSSTRRIVW